MTALYDYLTERIKNQAISHAISFQRDDIVSILLSFNPDLTFKLDNSKSSIADNVESWKSSTKIYKMLKDYLKKTGTTISKTTQKEIKDGVKKDAGSGAGASSSTSNSLKEPLNKELAAQISLQILKTIVKVIEETPDLKNQLTFLQAIQKMLEILNADQILSISMHENNHNNSSTNMVDTSTHDSSINENEFLSSLAETLNKCCNLEEEDFKNLMVETGKDAVKRKKKDSEAKTSISESDSKEVAEKKPTVADTPGTSSKKEGKEGKESNAASTTIKEAISTSSPATSTSTPKPSKPLSRSIFLGQPGTLTSLSDLAGLPAHTKSKTFIKAPGGQIAVPLESFFNAISGNRSVLSSLGTDAILSLAGGIPSGIGGSAFDRNGLGSGSSSRKEENRDIYQLYSVSLNVTQYLIKEIKEEFTPLVLKIGLVSRLMSLSKYYKDLGPPHPFDELDEQEEQDVLDRQTTSISSPKLTKRIIAIRLLNHINEIVEIGGFLNSSQDTEELKKLKEIAENSDKYNLVEILEQLSMFQYSVYDLISSKILVKINEKLENKESKEEENLNKSISLPNNFDVKPTLIKILIKTLEASEKIPTYPFTGLDSDSKPNLSVEKLANLRYFLKFDLARNSSDTSNILNDYKKVIKVEPMVLGQHLRQEVFQMVEKQWFEYPRSSLNILKKSSTTTSHGRPSNIFSYHSDFDENGLIYYLGTNGKKALNWSNPIKRKIMYATTSFGQNIPFGNIADFIERNGHHNVHTGDQENCWVAFDLGLRFQLSAYSLKHSRGYQKSALRNWQLQGSDDCETWKILKEHKNDLSLSNSAGCTKTWKLKAKACNRPYRYLRIQQTGPNSSGSSYHISMAGFEVYGKIMNDVHLEWPGVLETKINPQVLAQIKEDAKKHPNHNQNSHNSDRVNMEMEGLRRGIINQSEFTQRYGPLGSLRKHMLPYHDDDFVDSEGTEELDDDDVDEFERLGGPGFDNDHDNEDLDHELEMEFDNENLTKSQSLLKKYFQNSGAGKGLESHLEGLKQDLKNETMGTMAKKYLKKEAAKKETQDNENEESDGWSDIDSEEKENETNENEYTEDATDDITDIIKIHENAPKEPGSLGAIKTKSDNNQATPASVEKAKSTSDITVDLKKAAAAAGTANSNSLDKISAAKSSNLLTAIPESQNANQQTGQNFVVSLPEMQDLGNLVDQLKKTDERISTLSSDQSKSTAAVSVPCLSSTHSSHNANPIKRSSNTSDIPAEVIDEIGMQDHKDNMSLQHVGHGLKPKLGCIPTVNNLSSSTPGQQISKSNRTLGQLPIGHLDHSHLNDKMASSTQSLPMISLKSEQSQRIEKNSSNKNNHSVSNISNVDAISMDVQAIEEDDRMGETPGDSESQSQKIDKDAMEVSESIENAVSEVTSKSEIRDLFSEQEKSVSGLKSPSKSTNLGELDSIMNEPSLTDANILKSVTELSKSEIENSKNLENLNPDQLPDHSANDEEDWVSDHSDDMTDKENIYRQRQENILALPLEEDEDIDLEGDDDDDYGAEEDLELIEQLAKLTESNQGARLKTLQQLTNLAKVAKLDKESNKSNTGNTTSSKETSQTDASNKQTTGSNKTGTTTTTTGPATGTTTTTGTSFKPKENSLISTLSQRERDFARDFGRENFSYKGNSSLLEKIFNFGSSGNYNSSLMTPSFGYLGGPSYNSSRNAAEEIFTSGHLGRVKRPNFDLLKPYDPRPGRSNVPQTYTLRLPHKIKTPVIGENNRLIERSTSSKSKKEKEEPTPQASSNTASAVPEQVSNAIPEVTTAATNLPEKTDKPKPEEKEDPKQEHVNIKLLVKFDDSSDEVSVNINNNDTVLSAITRAYEKFYSFNSRNCQKNVKLLQDLFTSRQMKLKLEYSYKDGHKERDTKESVKDKESSKKENKDGKDNKDSKESTYIGLDENAAICLKLLSYLNKSLLRSYLTQKINQSDEELLDNKYSNHLALFTSPKIASKVSNQITDGIAATTKSLPRDILKIMNLYPFLVSEGLRQQYIKLSGSGFDRNIINYQDHVRNIQNQTNTGTNNDIQDSHSRYLSQIAGPSDYGRIRIHRAIVYRPEALSANMHGHGSKSRKSNSATSSVSLSTSAAQSASVSEASSNVSPAVSTPDAILNLSPLPTQNVLPSSSNTESTVATTAVSSPKPEIRPESSKKTVEQNKDHQTSYSGAKFLCQAYSVLKTHSEYKSKLEFQFKNEKGTGLAPTQEFYNLCCINLRLKVLNIWMDRENDTSLYHVSKLFPRPGEEKSVREDQARKFWMLGNIFGKVMLDQRSIGFWVVKLHVC